MEKALLILQVVGAVAVGLPALLHALVLFVKLIPGEQPDKFLEEKLLPAADKMGDLVSKLYPQVKK